MSDAKDLEEFGLLRPASKASHSGLSSLVVNWIDELASMTSVVVFFEVSRVSLRGEKVPVWRTDLRAAPAFQMTARKIYEMAIGAAQNDCDRCFTKLSVDYVLEALEFNGSPSASFNFSRSPNP